MSQTILRILAWGSIFVLFVVTDTTMGLRPHTIISPPVDRFVALVCVGAIFSAAYPKHRPAVLALLLVTVVGFELLQRLIAGRHGFVKDMVVKGAGACLGVFMSFTVQKLLVLVRQDSERVPR